MLYLWFTYASASILQLLLYSQRTLKSTAAAFCTHIYMYRYPSSDAQKHGRSKVSGCYIYRISGRSAAQQQLYSGSTAESDGAFCSCFWASWCFAYADIYTYIWGYPCCWAASILQLRLSVRWLMLCLCFTCALLVLYLCFTFALLTRPLAFCNSFWAY